MDEDGQTLGSPVPRLKVRDGDRRLPVVKGIVVDCIHFFIKK